MAQLLAAPQDETSVTAGEKRTAKCLIKHLPSRVLLWQNTPILGTMDRRPDFIILDPEAGLWILEVKDWKYKSLGTLNADVWAFKGGENRTSPLKQARDYAQEMHNALVQDARLKQPENSRWQGRLKIPYGYGVVMTAMTRKETNNLSQILPAQMILSADDLKPHTAGSLEIKLKKMMKAPFRARLTDDEINHLKGLIYPEIIIAKRTGEDYDVLDAEQEALARNIQPGHHVIHGVSGCGKTLILLYRAVHLAERANVAGTILILCYNNALALYLRQQLKDKKVEVDGTLQAVTARVVVRTFHQWCLSMMNKYHISIPCDAEGQTDFKTLVTKLKEAVDKGEIAKHQYPAILLDEGQDFYPQWLALVTSMLKTDGHLLLLYDKAQAIYGIADFNFQQVGIESTGRTKILTKNYRNSRDILNLAWRQLTPYLPSRKSTANDNGWPPLLIPQAAGRSGANCKEVEFSDVAAELSFMVQLIRQAWQQGLKWANIAFLFRTRQADSSLVQAVEQILQREKIPWKFLPDEKDAAINAVTLTTFHSSKGLEWPWVLIPGLSANKPQDAQEARLLYVAMSRATQQLIIGRTSKY